MSEPQVIFPRSAEHRCILPDPVELPVRTLARGQYCSHWSRCAEEYVAFGFQKCWLPVRWYHFRLRRQILEQTV